MQSKTVHKFIRMPDCPTSLANNLSDHSMVIYQGALYIFGGRDAYRGMSNDLLRYDIKSQSWTMEDDNGTRPPPMCGHSALVYKSSMLVYAGGKDSKNIFEYQFSKKLWSKLIFTNCDGPADVSGHSAVIYDDRLWILCSETRSRYSWYEYVWTRKLSSESYNWEIVYDGQGIIPFVNCPVAVVGDQMYILMADELGIKRLRKFSFKSFTWSDYSEETPIKCKLKSLALMVTSDHQFIVFDGSFKVLHCYDVNSEIWSVILLVNDFDIPLKIGYATAVFGDTMYIFGQNTQEGSNILYKLQLERSYSECSIQEGYGNLLTSRLFTDVEFIVGVKETKISAHIAIVAARSEYIRTSIREAFALQDKSIPVKDSPILEVKIPNAIPEVFEIVLNYIYTDHIELPDEKLDLWFYLDLYNLAVEINLKSLEQIIIEQLELLITSSNVLDILLKAHNDGLLGVKEYCLNFICRDVIYTDVIESKKFESFDSSLIMEVVRRKSKSSNVSSTVDLNCSTLTEDMKEFLNSVGKEFSDVTLLVGDDLIPAHKCILAARSSYFEAMFRSFMPPDNTVRIQIDEIIPSKEAFYSLLKYIYYRDVNIPSEHLLTLISGSDFYGFTNNDSFLKIIKRNLEDNGTFEQILQLLQEAHRTEKIDMKKYLLGLIVQRCPNISSWPQTHTLSQDLLLDIVDALVTRLRTFE